MPGARAETVNAGTGRRRPAGAASPDVCLWPDAGGPPPGERVRVPGCAASPSDGTLPAVATRPPMPIRVKEETP